MKLKTRLRVEAVEADTAQEFNEQMAVILERADAPQITYLQGATFRAFVQYKHTEYIAETIAEQYELDGKGEKCGACPFIVKTDDKRCVWQYCAQHNHKTKETTAACDTYYEIMEAAK